MKHNNIKLSLPIFNPAIKKTFRGNCFCFVLISVLFSVLPLREGFTGQVQYNQITLKQLYRKSDWIVLAEFVRTSGSRESQLQHFKKIEILKSPSDVRTDQKPSLLFSVQPAHTSERQHLATLAKEGTSKSYSEDFFTNDEKRFPLGNSPLAMKPGGKYILFLNYVTFLKKFEENLFEFSASGAFLDHENITIHLKRKESETLPDGLEISFIDSSVEQTVPNPLHPGERPQSGTNITLHLKRKDLSDTVFLYYGSGPAHRSPEIIWQKYRLSVLETNGQGTGIEISLLIKN